MTPSPVTHFIFDLDGLILDTEKLCLEVARQVLARHGKQLTPAAQRVALGKRPLDCWTSVAKELELEVPPEQLLEETEELLAPMWEDSHLLPGAERLLQHLAACSLPVAVATSTPRATFNKKMARRPHLAALFKVVICGDEVAAGKPAPDLFSAAAVALGADPASCLVLEDAPSGVEGATAAGMRVVVVPSMVDKAEYPEPDASATSGVVEVLPSLLNFKPEQYGLTKFKDLLPGDVVPVTPPLCIKGQVVKGFGRGSKELGIPTANVDRESLGATLSEAVTGIYAGWAGIGISAEVYPMVMSIGWNPFYGNKEKTAEPWILHHFEQPFYDQEIRLVVCGYIRPEASFTSLQALVDRIHEDAEAAKVALADARLLAFKGHRALLPS